MEKKFNYKTINPKLIKFWTENKIYNLNLNYDKTKLFSIDTPPPTVSGTLHIGHIFSYTHTDIIARYKRMHGFSVFYPFGFDTNGLPTERFVEKKYKTDSNKIGTVEFINLCLKTTAEYSKNFIALWESIGISANFEQTYSTISKTVTKISQTSFIKLLEKKLVYKKNEASLFCTTCQTSISQADLDDKSCETNFININFKTTYGEIITIATTRPELLGACVAIAYNPNDSRYKHLKNQSAIVPLYNAIVPIIEEADIEIDKGSGLVMIATFGDKKDIEWYKKHALKHINLINKFGKINSTDNFIGNLKVAAARETIISLLKKEEAITAEKQITHIVSIHDRCKNPVEFIMQPQWFVKTVEFKAKFLELADKIEWSPQHMKARFNDWVKNLNWDWSISRQRIFGIPFPVWYCKNCQQIFTPRLDLLPVDPRTEDAPNKNCDNCKSNQLIPETDVMDTWNTSSLTPYICKEIFNASSANLFEQNDVFLPMSLRPQAHDIIRTWAFDTIVKSAFHNNTIPWEKICISGHVLTGKSQKISKSEENAISSPEQLISEYSADAVRLWTASSNLGEDCTFSLDQIKIGQKFTIKLWNAFNFIKLNYDNFSNKSDLSKLKNSNDFGFINNWILYELKISLKSYHKSFETEQFSNALKSINDFFWNKFCDNYLELIKDIFFNPMNYTNTELLNTLFVLYEVGFYILQAAAPFMPFITEELYQLIYKNDKNYISIHTTQFNEIFNCKTENSSLIAEFFSIIEQTRKFKSEQQLSLKTEIENFTFEIKEKKLIEELKNLENLIRGYTKIKNINFS